MHIDLIQATLDELLVVLFDHPAASGSEPPWYQREELDVRYDARQQVALLTALFRSARVWRARFSAEQIEQGLWMVFADAPECFASLLWAPEVPWPERQAFLEAIETLYTELFPGCRVESIDYMIPDLLADGFDSGTRDPDSDPEARRIRDALYELFGRLLGHPTKQGQYAGLHGLGHLRHPAGKDRIQAYLDQASTSDESRDYAHRAQAGGIL